MKFKGCKLTLRKRRGLSSVVGALLFVVLMVATFAVLGVALNTQTDIVDTGRDVANIGLKKQQEDFIINSVIQNPGDVLQVHATSNGQNAAEIFTLVITNSSDIAEGYPTQTYEIPSDTSFLTPGNPDTTDIVSTLDLKLANAALGEKDTYSFKVISSLGTIKKLSIDCDENGLCGQSVGSGGSGGLAVTLFLDGPNGVNSKTSTVIMMISNIGDVPLEDIHPVRGCPDYGNFFPKITDAPPDIPGLAAFDPCALKPLFDPNCGSGPAGNNDGNGICLAKGQTGIFKWDGVVAGDIGDVFQFCNEVVGQEWDNTDVGPSNTDCDEMTVIDPNDCGGCDAGGEGGESIILLDDLLIRPSIFLTIPSPFGAASESDSLGIWGVNIANPTNSTMDVSKVTITAFAPGANENTKVFDEGAGDNVNISPIGPGLLGDWNLDQENVAVWLNFGDPITLDPYSNQFFALKVKPFQKLGKWESMIVQASVFTTSGSFGKSGYQTSVFSPQFTDGDSPIPNIYLTNVTDSLANANILGARDDIVNGTQQYFSVVFADMDTEDDTHIKAGAKVIVNVPREWDNVSVISGNTTNIIVNATQPSIKKHSDGTHQIIGITNKILGNGTGFQAATLSFTALAPEKTFENMHIMYILGYGLTEDDYTVGPQQEAVLHVIGNVTGYP